MTLKELKLAIAAMLRDDPPFTRWTPRDYGWAINRAIDAAWPSWYKESTDTSLTYAEDTFEYDVPAGIDGIVALELEPLSESRPYKFLTDWRVHNEKIYLSKNYAGYDGQKLRLKTAQRTTLFRNIGSDGYYYKDDGVATDATKTFTSVTGKFSTDGVTAGDWLLIYEGNGDANNGAYKIASVDSETQLTLVTSAGDGTGLTYSIQNDDDTTDVPLAYMLHMTAYFLFLLWGHKGWNKDIEAASQWAQYHYEQALLAMKQNKKARKPKEV